jgi:fucose 4-O-acetylase-like acetyltransferase
MIFPSVAQTSAVPADRDRTVDALRAVSLLVVVAGHAFMALPVWTENRLVLGNVLADSTALQAMTWVLQVMPLFFFAGGAASAHALRHRPAYASWVWSRLQRLYRPVLWSTVFWLAVSILALTVAPRGIAAPIAKTSLQLVWFLASYTMTLLLAPALLRAVRAHPVATVGGLLGAAAVTDAAALVWQFPSLAALNFALVWCVPFALGLLYGLGRFRGPRLLLVAGAALVTNIALVGATAYEISLVTVPGQKLSNMAPPTVVLALHAVVLCSVAAAARPLLTRILATRPRLWWSVSVVNMSAMTLYLWHLPVLIGVLSAAHVAGLDRPGRDHPMFVPATVLLLAVFGAATAAVVRLLWPTEHLALPWWDDRRGHPRSDSAAAPVVAGLAGAGVALGTLLLAKDGLAALYREGAMTWPALGVLLVALAVARSVGREPQRSLPRT